MGNISYFCIVKRFKYKIRAILLIIFLLLTDNISAQNSDSLLHQMDSVQISLLTCQPGKEVYSLYGHTAIRYQDKTHNIDIVVNYGLFSFGKPYFILRFIFGLTDYEMGIEPFPDFCSEYASEDRGVIQQTLNLTSQEKLNIANAINENYKPENRVYRYNYFYDNCTTRARDILVKNMNGNIKYVSDDNGASTYRDLIHQWNENHLWARFGNDMLLGVKADMTINGDQKQFLPDNLRKAFDDALIINKNGVKEKLVSNTQIIVQQSVQSASEITLLRPMTCSIFLLIITIFITIFEFYKKYRLWGFDLFLMLVDGLAGVILTAMIFSQHPTVSLNLQLLLLNPLPLFFAVPVIKCIKKGVAHRYCILATILIIMFFVGNFFQEYAEGMNIVALSLLIRCLSLKVNYRNK